MMLGQALVETWTEVRSSRGRLLFRLDVGRLLVEVKPKGGPVELVDLRALLGGRGPDGSPGEGITNLEEGGAGIGDEGGGDCAIS